MCVFSRLLLSCVVGCRGGGGQSFLPLGVGGSVHGHWLLFISCAPLPGGYGPGKSELTRSVAAKRERDGEGRKEGGGERWKMRRPLDSSAELGLGRAKKVCEGGVHRKIRQPIMGSKVTPPGGNRRERKAQRRAARSFAAGPSFLRVRYPTVQHRTSRK
jgi:hypothetical protein